ncbi:hypothetical protein [Geodermatophilus marinus]|uniref:hypothetical protein n=1 Tax=Geodermatophilus sp. LHW52908 TaxID=2303986 RepID=UPI000E3B7B78|nr:hypothetical protein [Geodermatophilus sp. LHW52908]RFU19956.1 hypothetical protein D0Z06_18540 [Geodermatophilus sp. LHW52908]
MTVLGPPPPAPAPQRGAPPPRPGPRRLLAVVTDRSDVAADLGPALAAARRGRAPLHVAVVLPRPPSAVDAELAALLVELSDRLAHDLRAEVRQALAAAGVPATVALHRCPGLSGRRRRRVLERTAARLARRLDAVVVGAPR